MTNNTENSTLKKILIPMFWIIVGYYINEGLSYLNEKPDVNIVMPTELEEDYLPIYVDNIGDKTLTNITIKINSCKMDSNKTWFIKEITKGRGKTIKFREEETIKEFKKLPCYDLTKVNITNYESWYKIYKHNITGELITPYQEFALDVCMFCFWDIYFFSDQINKTFREYTYQAGGLFFTVLDSAINISEEDLPHEFKEYSQIGCGIYDDRILETYS